MTSPARRPSPRPRPGPDEPATDVPTSDAAASDGPARGGSRVRGSRAVRIARASKRATASSAAESGRIWRASRAREPERKRDARTEPRFDSGSWLAAIIAMVVFTAVPWAVQIVNATQDYRLDRFGLMPRELHGLWGILTQPFLHASYADMLSDTLPVLVIGWVVMLAGARIWIAVTAVVVLVGGALTWLIAPGNALIIGCSGLVFGWLGYLVARAVFSRKIKWIVTAAMVLLVFGALLGQLVPIAHSHQGWQVHVASFAAGAGIAWLLHPHRKSARATRRRPSTPVVS